MIKEPNSVNHYGYLEAEQPMPAFAGQLTDRDVDTLARYLKGDYVKPTDSSHREAKPGSETARK